MLAQPGAARAQAPERPAANDPAPRGIVLVDAPAVLSSALKTALSPWGVSVGSVARDKPGASVPGTALQAGAIARELAAEALVWISRNSDGAALWLYEAGTDTLRARPFPDRPLDAALAAALALSVKTWVLSPTRTEPPAPSAPPPTAPPPPAPTPPPAPASPSSPDDAPEPPADERASAAEPPGHPRSRVLIYGAARQGVLATIGLETRHGMELRLAAWRSPLDATRLWLGARVETGAARRVVGQTFRGTYAELNGGLSLGLAQRLGSALLLGLHVGATLHRASVFGTLLPDGALADESSWGVTAQLRPELEIDFGPIGILFQPMLAAPLERHIYTVDDASVAESGAFWWMLGAALRLDAF